MDVLYILVLLYIFVRGDFLTPFLLKKKERRVSPPYFNLLKSKQKDCLKYQFIEKRQLGLLTCYFILIILFWAQ